MSSRFKVSVLFLSSISGLFRFPTAGKLVDSLLKYVIFCELFGEQSPPSDCQCQSGHWHWHLEIQICQTLGAGGASPQGEITESIALVPVAPDPRTRIATPWTKKAWEPTGFWKVGLATVGLPAGHERPLAHCIAH